MKQEHRKVKLVKFLLGLESDEFLTIGNEYNVLGPGSSQGSLIILDDELESCEIFEEEYEVVDESNS